jgi:succinate dehydrogenase hydrophobic anchor subunit
MPRWIARLIPALLLISATGGIYFAVRMILADVVTKKDQTRLVFLAIITIVLVIVLFSVTVETG